MNETERKLINLAGFELNAALNFARYQPNEARQLIENIEREIVESVAAGT